MGTRGIAVLAAACAVLLLVTGTAAARLTWSGPVAQDAAGNGPALVAVSCPTASECVAVDVDGGAVTFNPTAPVPQSPTVIDANGVTGLDCLSGTQCAVVDLNGQEVTFDPANLGGAVASTIDSGQILDGVSCARGSGTCTAIDTAGDEIDFTPGPPAAVLAAKQIDPSAPLSGVSCPPASSPASATCAAIDTAGTEIQFNPSTGATTGQSSAGGGSSSPNLTAVSCADASTCVVFDSSGDGYRAGTSRTTIDGGHSITAGDCVSDTQCTAIDTAGAAITFAPGATGTRTPIDGAQPYAVSCPSLTMCVAVDVVGHAVTFNPGSPAAASSALVDRVPSLTAIACPLSTQCTGADSGGGEVTFHPGTATGPTSAGVDPGAMIYGIACPGPGQCTAVDANGAEVTFNPGSPVAVTPVTLVHNHPLLAIACPVATQCTAVDDDQYAVTFDPLAPTTGRYAGLGTPPSDSLTGVACPSAVQCTAVDGTGEQVTFNPENPGAPRPTTVLPDGAVGVSCPSTTECTAVGVSGDRATFDPRSPAAIDRSTLITGRLVAVSCPSGTFCLAADASGHAVEFDPHGTGATAVVPAGVGASLTAVACASAGRCAGVDSANRAFVGTGPVPAPPAGSGAPRITGTARQGSLLREVRGRWSGDPTSYARQWERCRRGGVCRAVTGATAATYRLGKADVGDTIRVVERAANAGGSGAARVSRATARVTGKPAAPRFAATSLTGLRHGRPRLAFTVVADRWGPLLRSLTIVLPAGLTVARGAVIGVQPARHGVRYRLTGRGRTISLRLARSVSWVRLSVDFPGVVASSTLVRRAAQRHPGSLTLTGDLSVSRRLKFHSVGNLTVRS